MSFIITSFGSVPDCKECLTQKKERKIDQNEEAPSQKE